MFLYVFLNAFIFDANIFTASQKEVSSCNVSRLTVTGKKWPWCFFYEDLSGYNANCTTEFIFCPKRGQKRFLNEPLWDGGHLIFFFFWMTQSWAHESQIKTSWRNEDVEREWESSWDSCYSQTHNKNFDKTWSFWSPSSLGEAKQFKLRQWISETFFFY